MSKLILKSLIAACAAGLCAMTWASSASAYTECPGTVGRIFRGDSKIWVEINGGGVASINDTDPNFKDYLSMLITAKAANMSVTFRYFSDNESCSAIKSDIEGLWLG